MKKILLFALLAITSMLANAQETDVTTLDWTQKGQNCTKNFDNPGATTVFGTDAGGSNLSYVDVSAYGKINLYGTPNQKARLFVNREELGDPAGIFFVDINEEGVGVFDCNKLLELQPKAKFIHLNGVKSSAYNTTLNLSKITVSGDPIKLMNDVTVDISTLKQEDGGVTTITPTVEGGVYTYTATGGLQFAFKQLNYAIPEGRNQVVFTFDEPVASTGWCYSCVEGQGFNEIAKDTEEIIYDIPEGLTELPQIALFSLPWGTPAESIKLKSITFRYVESTLPELTYDVNLAADVVSFSKSNLKGNDFVFDSPIDISAYKYMIVTTIQSAGNQGNGMRLTDNNGFIIGEGWGATKNKGYDAGKAKTRGGMWLDRYNNQNCACININYLYKEGLDVENITKFSVPNGENISAIYLTNYEAGQAVKSTEGWGTCTGDYVRNNALLSEGKYGTIVLKYSAAVSGAKLYSIDAISGEYITLEEKLDGIAEAGIPYIYVACDFVGHDGEAVGGGTNSNVNFYKVDGKEVSTPQESNGLVGTFEDNGNVPAGAYVLSDNKFYLVDSEIPFAANKAYLSVPSSAKVLNIGEDDATAIQTLNALTSGNIEAIYGTNGVKQNGLQKGVNLVKMSNGTVKKVMVK